MLLVNNKKLTNDQKQFLAEHSFSMITILGGENAICLDIEESLQQYGTVRRISGSICESTSYEIAKNYFDETKIVAIANSQNFPDALCG